MRKLHYHLQVTAIPTLFYITLWYQSNLLEVVHSQQNDGYDDKKQDGNADTNAHGVHFTSIWNIQTCASVNSWSDTFKWSTFYLQSDTVLDTLKYTTEHLWNFHSGHIIQKKKWVHIYAHLWNELFWAKYHVQQLIGGQEKTLPDGLLAILPEKNKNTGLLVFFSNKYSCQI